MKSNDTYIYFAGRLYMILFRTSEPISPDETLSLFRNRFSDYEDESMLFEKAEDESTTCYNPIYEQPFDSFPNIYDVEAIKTGIDSLTAYDIRYIPVVWVMELYNGELVIVPEDDVRETIS